MPLVPKRQSVTIVKPGVDDGWGGTTPGEEIVMRARVSESVEKVSNQFGDEVISTAKIYLDNLADVNYDDVIQYEDELGRKIEKQPERIVPLRMINGKAIETKIYV